MKARLENKAQGLSRHVQSNLRLLKCKELDAPARDGHLQEHPFAWVALFLGIGVMAGVMKGHGRLLLRFGVMVSSELLRRDSYAPKN